MQNVSTWICKYVPNLPGSHAPSDSSLCRAIVSRTFAYFLDLRGRSRSLRFNASTYLTAYLSPSVSYPSSLSSSSSLSLSRSLRLFLVSAKANRNDELPVLHDHPINHLRPGRGKKSSERDSKEEGRGCDRS